MGPQSVPGETWNWSDLHAVALRQALRVLDRPQAEDAAQEALLRAWRHAGSCSGPDPAAWVATIARREALRLAARRTEDPLEEDQASTSTLPLGGADVREDRLDVRSALKELPRAEQEALLLHYWADMSHEEIARVLCIPLGTIKIRVFRGRRKLRPALIRR